MNKVWIFASIFIFTGFGLFLFGGEAKAYYTKELLRNGSFEEDPLGVGWINGYLHAGAWTPMTWHHGTRGVLMGDGLESISQSFDIPSNATSARLSFWYQYESDGPNSNTWLDDFYVEVSNLFDLTEVYFTQTMLPGSGETSGWTNASVDLSSAKGKTLWIYLRNYSLYAGQSIVALDDFSVTVELPDVTAPTTTLIQSPTTPNGNNSYYISVPSISLSASDDAGGSGVNKTYYNWDGGSYSQYTGPLSAPQGTHTLYYYSSDKAGNNEAVKTAVFKVDTNKPSVNAALSIGTPDGANGWYKTAPTITLSVADGSDGSGIDVIRYRLDGGGNLLYTSAFSVPEGVHTLMYSAVDKAGNSSDEASIVLKIDATDLVLTLNDASYQQTVNTATVTVKGTVLDNGSGVAGVTINGIPATVQSSGNFSVQVELTQGNNQILVVATDNAGRSVNMTKTVVYKKGQVLGDAVERPVITKIRKNAHQFTRNTKLSQRVVITGLNFKKTTKVKIGKLSIQKARLLNSKSLEIFVPLSKLKVGKYDVEVRNADGQSMKKSKGFTITR